MSTQSNRARRPLIDPDEFELVARPLPVAIVFDWSWSMEQFENQILPALQRLPSEFAKRPVTRNSAEIALITLGEDVVLRTGDPDSPPYGFVHSSDFIAPAEVRCEGTTELDVALDLAVLLLERRCRQISESGRSMYRPYLAVISDGDPTDEEGEPDDTRWRAAAKRLSTAVEGRLSVEAFVPQDSQLGMLPELVGGRDRVRPFDPANLAAVIEAVSFSADRGGPQRRRPIDSVRDDWNAAEGGENQ